MERELNGPCSSAPEWVSDWMSNSQAANDPRSARTMPELLRAVARAYGDAPAVTLSAETIPDDALSFAELEARSAQLARGLIARGAGKGTRIGYIYGNSPSFALMFAAISRIGAIAIPISTLVKGNELVRILRQSDVAGLIVQRTLLGKDYVERVGEALALNGETGPGLMLPQAPYLRWIVSTGADLPPAIQPLEWLTGAAETVSEDLLRAVEAEVHPTDQVIEIYTSGSMALPKGVKHDHGPLVYRAQYLAAMLGLEPGAENPVPLPMFWVGGLMMYLLPDLVAGATTACTEGTSTSNRFSMGSVLAKEDMAAINQKPPYWGLGMSETLGPYSWGDEQRAEGRLLCAPMDHFADRYEVRIADENNQPVGDGEIGELQIRGYPVTTGLHKIERDAYFTPDGYFRTGDMCEVEGSRIHFVGRDGDMIKTSSSNVSPAEVEMELMELPGIHVAYVLGLPDEQRGQMVAAAVVPRENVELDFAGIEAALKQRMSGYKVPKAYAEFRHEEIPMLPSNKVARRVLAEMLAERLGRGAA
jgi:acyl-CoA synthetase (AMP-forming)/AMP-acid ligase II